jgi:hypothetical protein
MNMATWRPSQQHDEFFGDADSDEEVADVAAGSQRRCLNGSMMLLNKNNARSMSAAESAAQEERFRTIGYHEAFDRHKEEKLQVGFQSGYREAFDGASRIGYFLGRATMRAIRGDEDTKSRESSSIPAYLSAAKEIRDFLSRNDQADFRKPLLEDLEQCLIKRGLERG